MLWLTTLASGSALAAALYMVLSPRFNYGLWRPLLFHPMQFEPGTERPPVAAGVDGEDVFFDSAGAMSKSKRKLHAWHYKVAGATKTILFSHGNAGNLSYRLPMIELMIRSGASVFIYDYSGFGLSEGAPTLEGIVEDGLAAFDYLVGGGVAPESIVIYGESLGAAVSMQIAALRQSHGVVLQSGFASLRQIAREVFPLSGLYPSRLFPSQQLDTVALLKQPHRPLLIIHGELDEVVPFSHAERLYAHAVSEKYFLRLPQTAHCDIGLTAPVEYVEALSQFLLLPQGTEQTLTLRSHT